MKGIKIMLNGKKSKALLIGTMVVSTLFSGCGVEKDSDDRVMLEIEECITEVTSDGQETLLDTNYGSYWQYDSDDNLLIASNCCTEVSIYNLDTGDKTDIGFPMIDGRVGEFDYEGQRMYGINTWYEDGYVNIYASDIANNTLVVFTFDCTTEELADTACYDIQSSMFVRDTGNSIVYVNSQRELNIYDKTTGENETVAGDIGYLGAGFDLIVLNGDRSKVLFARTEDEVPVLYEYDIPSGDTREVYRCSKGNYITGFTYALDSNKIYLRYGKKYNSIAGYGCLPNHTMVITTDGRNYELHSSLIDGYSFSKTGIVIY